MLPLEGLLVVDFSIFLAGPSAGLRLADLGARVVKIERPDGGDLCRKLYVTNVTIDGESTIFHAINRNKLSVSANLKDAGDRARVMALVERADVLLTNFRPGVMRRLGLDYENVRERNPRLVYGEVTGYGRQGPWKDLPGQDLLAQCLSGLVWWNGTSAHPPLPIGLAIADIMAGANLAQGVLACLVRRGRTGRGARVEVSLLESMIEIQAEGLMEFFLTGGMPQREPAWPGHPYRPAPCGIYPTADGYIALGECAVPDLSAPLALPELSEYVDPAAWMARRAEIKAVIASRLRERCNAEWVRALDAAGIACMEVLSWDRLMVHPAFARLEMLQEVRLASGTRLRTTRCPIRIDGRVLKSPLGAPAVGEHNQLVLEEYDESQSRSEQTQGDSAFQYRGLDV
ncbi:CoA transferase [bacterium]|nr:CoA transferase [bacterium]